ncbi:nucleotidyltransferase family protein [Verrucomicrobium sp. 3C]|uniref:nucleotidyltransferase family protein n=1 Tax=Verrucomicrobium sp. 3C TaxID=1134055 RepID=UPI00036BDCE5|nr:nucleotidyltransferase family protein [Verrucomicrobium sp. 3C]
MEVEELLCAVLRGENPAWPNVDDDRFAARLIERSAYHGVQALVHHRLGHRADDGGLGWPKAVLEACRNQAVAQGMRELRHRWLLACVLERLSEIGVRPIFFKGTALAYDLYPAPFLRTRADTDLLVPPDTRDPVIQALEALGFAGQPNVSGDFITYEAGFAWLDPAANQTHSVDLHWRINNSELLSHLFSYEELWLFAVGSGWRERIGY